MGGDEDAVCQVCGESLGDGRPITRCASCDTPHHEDCWTFLGRCSTFGCPGAVPKPLAGEPGGLEPRPAEPPAPEFLRFPIRSPWAPLPWVLAGVSVLVAGLLPATALSLAVLAGFLLAAVFAIPAVRPATLLVDPRKRLLLLDAPTPGAPRTLVGSFEDVRHVRLFSVGTRGRVRCVLVFVDGREIRVGDFRSARRGGEWARELARAVGVRLLLGAGRGGFRLGE